MRNVYAKTPSGQPLAFIETNSDGKQTLTDVYGRILGFYFPDRNQTTDPSGTILGYGNLLGTLIPKG